jgi:hypothetical protein
MARRVVCGRLLVIAILVPTRAFISVDLPTLGRPAKHAKPDRKAGAGAGPGPGSGPLPGAAGAGEDGRGDLTCPILHPRAARALTRQR